MAATWQFLTGDVNWREYGGTWYKQDDYDKDVFYTVQFINFVETTGEYYNGVKYVVIIATVDIGIWDDSDIKSALSVIGMTMDDLNAMSENDRIPTLVEVLLENGYADQDEVLYSDNAYKLLREAKSRY